MLECLFLLQPINLVIETTKIASIVKLQWHLNLNLALFLFLYSLISIQNKQKILSDLF